MNYQTKVKARELLGSVHLRRTRPRTSILGVLLDAVKPLTQEQIAVKLGGEAPDKVTIYRTLETFVDSGLVHKAYLRERAWHFELAHNCSENQCHPHFTCTDCGDTHCLTDVSIPLATTEKTGFSVSRQRVQLEGLCPKCNTNT